MIDLETLGTENDSVFLSIAAVQFDIYTGETGKEFTINIELESAMREGRKLSSQTLKWWLDQKPEIMALMFKDSIPMIDALQIFCNWWYENNLIYPWGNSASFDLGMLGHAINHHLPFQSRPWKPYNERCYRTVFAISGLGRSPKPEDAHNPLSDCKHQIKELHRALQSFRG